MKKVKIVTHNAGFHTDDVFAVATLSLGLEKEGKEFTVTRSRDMEIAKAADYLIDYGGIDDPNTNRFDHHQEGGAGKRENGIPFASFGLVWKKFGESLCGNMKVANKIDQILVQPIDALDNGIDIVDRKIQDVSPFDLGFLTFMFYPTWKEDQSKLDEIFLNLVSYAKVIIQRLIVVTSDEVEAEKLVIDAYHSAEDKRLIVLENSRYPWAKVLSQFPEPLYAVYKNPSVDTWSIICVRDDVMRYGNRKNLPKEWAGKRDQDLEKITGVAGAVFAHNARFMAVAKTKEAILEMAKIALENKD